MLRIGHFDSVSAQRRPMFAGFACVISACDSLPGPCSGGADCAAQRGAVEATFASCYSATEQIRTYIEEQPDRTHGWT